MSTPFVGEIRMFGYLGNRTVRGWKPCDGSLLAISEYEVLFTLIGTIYGGDGQTTFAVPDLRGRVPIHQGQGPGLSNYLIGQRAGTETVTLTASQMPAHTHALSLTTAAATVNAPSATVLPGSIGADTLYTNSVTGLNPTAMAATSISAAGATQPHENTMPTLTVSFFIATEGIFPSQG